MSTDSLIVTQKQYFYKSRKDFIADTGTYKAFHENNLKLRSPKTPLYNWLVETGCDSISGEFSRIHLYQYKKIPDPNYSEQELTRMSRYYCDFYGEYKEPRSEKFLRYFVMGFCALGLGAIGYMNRLDEKARWIQPNSYKNIQILTIILLLFGTLGTFIAPNLMRDKRRFTTASKNFVRNENDEARKHIDEIKELEQEASKHSQYIYTRAQQGQLHSYSLSVYKGRLLELNNVRTFLSQELSTLDTCAKKSEGLSLYYDKYFPWKRRKIAE